MLGRRRAIEYRKLLNTSAAKLQPLIRGFLTRMWFQREGQCRHAAIAIQCVMRGHSARIKMLRLRARIVYVYILSCDLFPIVQQQEH